MCRETCLGEVPFIPVRSDLRPDLCADLRDDLYSDFLTCVLIHGPRSDLCSDLRTDLCSEPRSGLCSKLRADLCSEPRSGLCSKLRADICSDLRSDLCAALRTDLRSVLRADPRSYVLTFPSCIERPIESSWFSRTLISSAYSVPCIGDLLCAEVLFIVALQMDSSYQHR